MDDCDNLDSLLFIAPTHGNVYKLNKKILIQLKIP